MTSKIPSNQNNSMIPGHGNPFISGVKKAFFRNYNINRLKETY